MFDEQKKPSVNDEAENDKETLTIPKFTPRTVVMSDELLRRQREEEIKKKYIKAKTSK